MSNQSMITDSKFSTEQYQDILADRWERLTDIKLMLEDEHKQDITAASIASARTCIYEIIKLLSALPDHFVLTYIVSRDALLTYLQKASLELHLAHDQLVALGKKGKTRRYYSALLLCEQYIYKALEQKKIPDKNWEDVYWKLSSFEQKQNKAYKRDYSVSIQQGRQYQMELSTAQEALDCLYMLFQESLEIWPDQCARAFVFLSNIQALMQDICSFLDSLACSQAAVYSYYCQTIVTLHSIHEQVRDTAAQVACYRIICRSSALRSIHTKQLISEALTNIMQHTDDGLRSFTILLDLASFQERRADGEQAV